MSDLYWTDATGHEWGYDGLRCRWERLCKSL